MPDKLDGRLSIVATPIGNLEDITLRALRTLKEADLVLCEDTRVTGKLLAHYDIKQSLRRYDTHTSERAHQQIVAELRAGKHIALVSDAGTPGISDPGVFLVAYVRREAPDTQLETVPGASALTAAFSLAGIPGNAFSFLGFVPQKKGRETFFKDLGSYDHPVMFYESVHRIVKTLESLVEYYGENRAPGRPVRVLVARELTKFHEEVVPGTPEEVLRHFLDHPDHLRGEFVVIMQI